MKSGLYICPGAPATCSAAVRAIWLARPGTSVSKLNNGFSRLRDGSGKPVDGVADADVATGDSKVAAPGRAPFRRPPAIPVRSVDGRSGAEPDEVGGDA